MRLSLAILVLTYSSAVAVAEDLTGWCFPADGCSGEEAIRNNSFSTCEESCSLENPVRIKGMKAKFYDQQCHSDGNGSTKTKIIIAPSQAQDGLELYYVTDGAVIKLKRCDQD